MNGLIKKWPGYVNEWVSVVATIGDYYALRVQHGELGHVNSQTLAGNTRSVGYHLMEHSILTLIAVFRYRRIMHEVSIQLETQYPPPPSSLLTYVHRNNTPMCISLLLADPVLTFFEGRGAEFDTLIATYRKKKEGGRDISSFARESRVGFIILLYHPSTKKKKEKNSITHSR